MYDRWTPENRAKALQLDASITASQVELDKLHLFNEYRENRLPLYEDDQLCELVHVIGEILLMRDRLEENKSAVDDHYRMELPTSVQSSRTKEIGRRDG